MRLVREPHLHVTRVIKVHIEICCVLFKAHRHFIIMRTHKKNIYSMVYMRCGDLNENNFHLYLIEKFKVPRLIVKMIA